MSNKLQETKDLVALLRAEHKEKRSSIASNISGMVEFNKLHELEYLTLVKTREEANLIAQIKAKTTNLTNEEQKELDNVLKKEKEINVELDKGIKIRQRHVDVAKILGQQLKIGWKYLQDQDKIIKSTVLNLGMSSVKAVAMRDAFEQSAGYVTRLGGTIGDIKIIMEGYADETGRARAMTADTVKNITDIGKGTGLGISQATRLGAQFELMGFDAKGTMEYVQGVVDTSERMGVNTTKVLKNITTDFKKLNTYTFQQGVKGFAQMAMYAEKFKIDINQALNAVDIARSLEGAIDLAAQLQVMGGEFAKTDPFEMLFLSRNDPAKFTEKIADMTKGIVSFRRMSDGSFEKFISPADRDRLAAVAKSMNMEASALTEIAERQAEIQKMRQQTAGLGLSPKEQELIEGAAMFDKESGKFQVRIGTSLKSIGELTSTQAKSFASEQILLKDRAKEAMTFDETFQATINTLKASLLPLLDKVNWLLDHTLKPIADMAAKGWGVGGAAAALIGAALAWKGVVWGLTKLSSNWVQTGSPFKGVGGTAATGGVRGFVAGGANGIGQGADYTKTGMIRKGAAGLHKAKGLQSLAKGAGTGLAAAGIGAGIAIGAQGIGELAQSIKDVDVEKLEAMNWSIAILGGTMIGILVPSIFAIGAAGTYAAPGLIALGLAAVGIGFGISLATKGIGEMSEGIVKMGESSGAGKELFAIAGGIAAITAAMSFGMGVIGIATLSLGLASIASNSAGIEKVGVAFSHIQTVLSGTKDDFIAVENAIESISNANIKKSGFFKDLSNIMKKPLEVKFSKSSVKLINDITLEIDKTKFMHKIFDPEIAVQMINDMKNNH